MTDLLIDSHAHLEMPQFDRDRAEALERAGTRGVQRILTVGTNKDLSRKAADITLRNTDVLASVGIHPHDSPEADEEGLAVLESLAATPKVVALGEIGLDFYKNYSPRDAQRSAFARQLDLAERLVLPLILHIRDAHDEALDILQKRSVKSYSGVLHCFSGNMDHARRALELGFSLSFPGTITFQKKMPIHEVMARVEPERMMLETDCPYLTPAPHRGKRNEPAYVEYVYKAAAEILGRSRADLETSCAVCFADTFRLNPKTLRGPVFAYPLRGNLYFNLTNRCSNDCAFCLGRPVPRLREIDLELPYEPSVAEVLRQAGPDLSQYGEVVFCGVGEPTLRLDVLKEVAAQAKKRGAKRVRLDTNGQANLIHGRNVVPELAALVDSAYVSLNAPDAPTYAKLCRPQQGEKAFDAMIDFVKKAKESMMEVKVSAVALAGLDLAPIRQLAASLEVDLKIRLYYDPKDHKQ